jgi:hypothetical protein
LIKTSEYGHQEGQFAEQCQMTRMHRSVCYEETVYETGGGGGCIVWNQLTTASWPHPPYCVICYHWVNVWKFYDWWWWKEWLRSLIFPPSGKNDGTEGIEYGREGIILWTDREQILLSMS